METLTFRVFDPSNPEETLATVTFDPRVHGENGCVTIDARDSEIVEFLTYYLDDPLDQRPVYFEGLGAQHGPHTANAEVFERAMYTVSHYFPGFETELA